MQNGVGKNEHIILNIFAVCLLIVAFIAENSICSKNTFYCTIINRIGYISENIFIKFSSTNIPSRNHPKIGVNDVSNVSKLILNNLFIFYSISFSIFFIILFKLHISLINLLLLHPFLPLLPSLLLLYVVLQLHYFFLCLKYLYNFRHQYLNQH